jgi:Cof subfamily protein (haloacid dehalogenase superfamily)
MNTVDLVISDVDGTLVTPDKQLTVAAIAAVKKLHERGIGFTITSSRPSFGMRMFVAPLGLRLPLGAFNGSSIVSPALEPIANHTIPEAIATKSIALLKQSGVAVWVFTNTQWFVGGDEKDGYIAREQYTIDTAPVVVPDLSACATGTCKIVGVSADFEKLAKCETTLQQALGVGASAVRSQNYYLDITPAGFDKGTFVEAMALRLGISTRRIATVGDMRNDIPMFAKSGVSYAMGNANDEVKSQASAQTSSNEEDGFAKAIDGILAGVAGR